MSKQNIFDTSASDSIKRAIESIKDGIVIVYSDHLHCDAFEVYVRKGGEIIKPDTKYTCRWDKEEKREVIVEKPIENSYTDYLKVDMMSNSNYYGTVGLPSTIKKLREKYELPVYFLSLGWYTFPQKFLNTEGYFSCIQERIPDAQLYVCDYSVKEEENK